MQRCSRCHKVGHNASSKACQAALIQPGEHDGEAAALLGPAEGGDDDAGGLDAVPVEAGAAPMDMSDQEGMDVFDESQNIGEGLQLVLVKEIILKTLKICLMVMMRQIQEILKVKQNMTSTDLQNCLMNNMVKT